MLALIKCYLSLILSTLSTPKSFSCICGNLHITIKAYHDYFFNPTSRIRYLILYKFVLSVLSQLKPGKCDIKLIESWFTCKLWTITEPTNGPQTNHLTMDWSKLINHCWQTLHESYNQLHHGKTGQSVSTDQSNNIIDFRSGLVTNNGSFSNNLT